MASEDECLLDAVLFTFTLFFCRVTGMVSSHVDGAALTLQNIMYRTSGISVEDLKIRVLNFFCPLYTVLISLMLYYWLEYNGTSLTSMQIFISINVTQAYLCCIVTLLARPKRTVKCIIFSAKKYCASKPSLRSSLMISLFIMFYTFAVVFTLAVQYFSKEFSWFYNSLFVEICCLPGFAITLLVCCMALVVERGYISLNLQLGELKKWHPSNSKVLDIIRVLMFQHEAMTDILEGVNACFSFDLIIILAKFMTNIVFYTYFIPHTFIAKTSYLALGDMLYLIGILGKFFMIGYRCQELLKQINLMKTNLLSLRVEWLAYHDEDLEEMLTDFYDMVEARKIVINAGGFTDMDLSVFVKLTGTSFMYALAALQYRFSSFNKLASNSTNITAIG